MKKGTFTLLLLCSMIYGYGQQMGCNGDRYFNTVFENVTVTSNIQYGQNTTLGGNTIDLMMDIYEPTADQLEKRPVIVFAHGGGFTSGNKEDITSGLSNVNFPVECERILRLIKAEVPAHSTAT